MSVKLVNHNWEHQIILEDGSSTQIIIENSELLRAYLMDLIRQTNGEAGPFVLSSDDEIVSISDRLLVITDPLMLDVAEKRLTNKVQTAMKQHMVSENHYEDTMELVSRIEAYSELLQSDFPFNVCHHDIDPVNLIKVMNFELQTDYENEIEKIMEYVNLMHDICGIDSFVFASLSSYFNCDALNVFIKECISNKHNLLFIERSDLGQVLYNTRKIIIDKDACEIFD